MYLQKVISKKLFSKIYFFVGILKVTDKKSRIRIHKCGSGSIPQCLGSSTLASALGSRHWPIVTIKLGFLEGNANRFWNTHEMPRCKKYFFSLSLILDPDPLDPDSQNLFPGCPWNFPSFNSFHQVGRAAILAPKLLLNCYCCLLHVLDRLIFWSPASFCNKTPHIWRNTFWLIWPRATFGDGIS